MPWLERVAIEGGYQLEPQLYDLSADIGEQNNLAKDNPEMLHKLSDKLNKILGKHKLY